MMKRSIEVAALASLTLSLACGQPPVPVGNPSYGSPTADGPARSIPAAQTPKAAPASDDGHGHDPAVAFAGVIQMTGELAALSGGFIFVSVKPDGIRMPSYSRKYSLSDPAFTSTDGSDRILHFQLTEDHNFGGLVPGGIVLEARYDPDGYVETKEGQVTGTVAIEPGEQHAVLVLARE